MDSSFDTAMRVAGIAAALVGAYFACRQHRLAGGGAGDASGSGSGPPSPSKERRLFTCKGRTDMEAMASRSSSSDGRSVAVQEVSLRPRRTNRFGRKLFIEASTN